MSSANNGSGSYSLDKTAYQNMMVRGVIYFLVGYYLFLGVYSLFLIVMRATDLNNEYLTQNIIMRPLFAFLQKTDFYKAGFMNISIETFFKSTLIFIYTILFVLLMKDLFKLHLYTQLYGTIQLNPNNNPTKNMNMITKIVDNPLTDATTYLFKTIVGLIFIFAYPFIILYFIRCYDVQNHIGTQVAVISMLFVPVIYYLSTHLATMKGYYKTDDILNYGKKYMDEKDYAYIDMCREKYNYNFDNFLALPLILLLITVFYFFSYFEIQFYNPLALVYLLIPIVIIPLILIVFNYNVLFSCYTKDNECGIFRNGLIKYEVYHEGIRSYYDALVKYNYLCYPK